MSGAAPEFAPVAEQLEQLLRGVVDVTTREELERKLARSRQAGRPLTVKVGFDPTAPDIHLGHTVLLRKMRQFQDLGHRVIFVIGDFTGMIGDPTGQSKTRPALTREQIAANAETYKRQCFKVLQRDATEIRFNQEWLGALGSEGLIRLAARYNVARMLERNDFKKRFHAGQAIALHEFLYPLAQAYDSVALAADVELGGTDQLFNLNVGRDVMPSYGLEPQVVLTTPLLEGLDGKEKMSKSLGNYVGIDEAPSSIFGKVMSVSDELMWRYYELCTDLSAAGLGQLRELVAQGRLHPKQAKEGLAMRLIADFHDEAAAKQAREEFQRVFAAQGVPDQVPEHRHPAGGGKAFLPELLAAIGLASSRSEAQRLLRQGAVEVDGRRVEPGAWELPVAPGGSLLFKVGKRRFARVTFD
ncbi:MAG TPA: tyrosine--tRNA ligase [Candidatus Polarisedimenticolaceae bacterium]|nr:tyrosine--tRNA ligase [Candidatus Polarisedimenticolaceae bacterium]